MTRFLHSCRWLSLFPATMCVGGALVMSGCGGGPAIDEPPDVHPDTTKNQDAMTEYMKKNPRFGKPGGPGGPSN